MREFFGTDGVRGVANEDLTPELALNLGKAVCQVLEDDLRKTMIIGSDTRTSCDMLKAALIAGITSMGKDVVDLGVIPTPGVCFLMDYYKASAGFVISASHNSEEYNGIKIFGPSGEKLADEEELEIEKLIKEPKKEVFYNKDLGTSTFDASGLEKYKNFLKEIYKEDLSNKKIVIDCANGSTFNTAPEIFKELGAEVIQLATNPNGVNINDGVGSTHPEIVQKKVVEEKAHVGFSYDGDGDRLIAVDDSGNIMNGDHILAALSCYFKKTGQLKNNAIVGTVMSNLGLQIFAKEKDIKYVETAVGDRYIQEELFEKDYSLGGEQSGHIIIKDYNHTGDGILASLLLLKASKELEMSFTELNNLMTSLPQIVVNAKVTEDFKSSFEDLNKYQEKLEELKSLFREDGRVLVRPSGTEPLIRVMIEGTDLSLMEEKAHEFAKFLEGLCE